MIEFFQALSWHAIGQIIIIDIMLGGDNAVVIALACKGLPHNLRRKGIVLGTVGAIALRLILLVFALQLLNISGIKFFGGILLLWIGAKMIIPEDNHHDESMAQSSLWGAIKTIAIADLIMSLDNVLAISGAAVQSVDAEHQLPLVIIGILLSIPIIVWGSSMVLKLLDRFPIFIMFGAALLGWIAGGMMLTDPYIIKYLGTEVIDNSTVYYAAHIAGIIIVLAFGKFLTARYENKNKLDVGTNH